VSSDDPAMFGTTLLTEWRVLSRHLGLTPAEVAAVGRRTIEAAFLSEDERRALLAEFDAAASAAAGGVS
jgi:adenosine deaminase